MFGRRERVGQFVLSLLATTSVSRYENARGAFASWCLDRRLDFDNLSEESQDWTVGDYLLDARDDGLALQHGRDLVAALQ